MGRIKSMQCSNCGAGITPPEKGQKIMIYPYCATPLEYDDGDTNININKRINKVKHTFDHAKMAEWEYKDREDKRIPYITWIP